MSKDLSSSKERKRLRKKDFALPGKRKYPIPDKAHARNALARVAQNGTPKEQRKVRAAVHKRFPSIGDESNAKKSSRKNSGAANRTVASKRTTPTKRAAATKRAGAAKRTAPGAKRAGSTR